METITPKAQSDWGPEIVNLYRHHYEALVSLARRLLDVRHLAEEAVQDAFLKYHLAESRPQRGCEVGYLRMITLNNARSMMRRKQCAERWRPEDRRVSPSVEDVALVRQDRAQVRRACAVLPDRQREVLELRYFGGLSVAEVADRLAISTGAVKTHSSRAREALRRELQAVAA